MKPVWEKPSPNKHSEKLTPDQKSRAKSRALRAGRPYPNMVDNIWAAQNEQTVSEAMSAQHRFALALQRERERREARDQARKARESAAKPHTFTSYIQSKGKSDEKTG